MFSIYRDLPDETIRPGPRLLLRDGRWRKGLSIESPIKQDDINQELQICIAEALYDVDSIVADSGAYTKEQAHRDE